MTKISNRVKAMDASGIRKIFELASQVKNPINLSIGQPDFNVPKDLKEFAKQAIDNNQNSYTPTTGILPLRQAIVDKFKTKKIETTVDNVLITGAVSGAISLVLPTLLDKDDEVIIFDPYFVGYKQLVLLYDGKPVFVKKNEDFSINFDLLEQAITSKTKVIMLNTPENPTGYVYTKEETEKLADLAKKYDLYIISDEIYEDFVYEKQHYSIARIYDKTILVNGFSKSHAMTGWRVGFMIAPQEIISQAAKIQQFTFVCAPTPFQYASLEALNYEIDNYVEEYLTRRNIIYDGLKNNYEINKCDGAFYFYIKYPYDGKKFIQDCLDKKLLLVPGESFSEEDTHFRLSFVNTKEKLKKAVEILNELVES